MKEVHVVVQNDWSYDDSYYWPTDGHHVIEAFNDQDSADKRAAELNRREIREMILDGSIARYCGEDVGWFWRNLLKATNDLGLTWDYDFPDISKLADEDLDKLIEAGVSDCTLFCVMPVTVKDN